MLILLALRPTFQTTLNGGMRFVNNLLSRKLHYWSPTSCYTAKEDIGLFPRHSSSWKLSRRKVQFVKTREPEKQTMVHSRITNLQHNMMIQLLDCGQANWRVSANDTQHLCCSACMVRNVKSDCTKFTGYLWIGDEFRIRSKFLCRRIVESFITAGDGVQYRMIVSSGDRVAFRLDN